MTEYTCQECWWNGTINTNSPADENRRAVETTQIDHCPVCGTWGLAEQ